MGDLPRVQVVQRGGDLPGHAAHERSRREATCSAALGELKEEVNVVVCFDRIVDTNDIGVADHLKDADLAEHGLLAGRGHVLLIVDLESEGLKRIALGADANAGVRAAANLAANHEALLEGGSAIESRVLEKLECEIWLPRLPERVVEERVSGLDDASNDVPR